MTWHDPQAATVVVFSSPWAKVMNATMIGTRPTATSSQPHMLAGASPARSRRHASSSRIRLRTTNATPKPWIHWLVVPIQPRGSGTPGSPTVAAPNARSVPASGNSGITSAPCLPDSP